MSTVAQSPCFSTTTSSGVRVIAYQQASGFFHARPKWHVTIPGFLSPGCDLSDALSNVVGRWDGKTRIGRWHGGDLTELTNEQFASLDESCTESVLFWLNRI
jgi:hypothetical protein